MVESYDVVIIGAGPAGSVVAKCLADKQLKVILIEKKELPRHKTCSGIIGPTAQAFAISHFGEIPDECFCKPRIIKGFRIFTPDGGVLETPVMEVLNVWRSGFDYWLARESGAPIKSNCLFLSAQEEKGTCIVKLRENGEDIVIRTRYLIGADGADSKVRRLVLTNPVDDDSFIMAYEEHWTGTADIDPDFFYAFPDQRFCEIGMANILLKNDRWIIENGVRKGSKIKPLFRAFFNYLKDQYNFKPGEMLLSNGCLAFAGAGDKRIEVGKGNVLLVGEAGGFLGGMMEGITPAFYTGEIAAAAIIESINTGLEAAAIYTRMVEPEEQRLREQREQTKGLLL